MRLKETLIDNDGRLDQRIGPFNLGGYSFLLFLAFLLCGSEIQFPYSVTMMIKAVNEDSALFSFI